MHNCIIVIGHGVFLLRLFLVTLEAAVLMSLLHNAATTVAVSDSHSVRITVAFATLAFSLCPYRLPCSP